MLFPNVFAAAAVLSTLVTGLPVGDRPNGIAIMGIARRNAEPDNPLKKAGKGVLKVIKVATWSAPKKIVALSAEQIRPAIPRPVFGGIGGNKRSVGIVRRNAEPQNPIKKIVTFFKKQSSKVHPLPLPKVIKTKGHRRSEDITYQNAEPVKSIKARNAEPQNPFKKIVKAVKKITKPNTNNKVYPFAMRPTFGGLRVVGFGQDDLPDPFQEKTWISGSDVRVGVRG
ncbi:hypothetical protein HYFRA_00001764 [Hymenoscyphus fraxineus]|uniref:Uncharacterized protein n=1 Tax=Hymenoscyphus fraxineus TaxID=746836 RepID=A0A9N9KMF7_9HELO|nr:hypothetical protein HYFRA_00001764 [Hymenoscyphus fraxineus]